MGWHWHHDSFGASGGWYPDKDDSYLQLTFNYQRSYFYIDIMAPIIGDNSIGWNSKEWRNHPIYGTKYYGSRKFRQRRMFEFDHRSLKELKAIENGHYSNRK